MPPKWAKNVGVFFKKNVAWGKSKKHCLRGCTVKFRDFPGLPTVVAHKLLVFKILRKIANGTDFLKLIP